MPPSISCKPSATRLTPEEQQRAEPADYDLCDKHSEQVQQQNRINNPGQHESDFGRGSEGLGDLLKRRAQQVPFDQSERLNTNGASNARRAGSHRSPFHSEY
jgi:hypothetical protein